MIMLVYMLIHSNHDTRLILIAFTVMELLSVYHLQHDKIHILMKLQLEGPRHFHRVDQYIICAIPNYNTKRQ